MDIWKILGIEKTDDEDAIKAAYLARLADQPGGGSGRIHGAAQRL